MDFITYAKRNNRLLNVVVKDSGEERYFHYTPDQLKRSLSRYCAWYNTEILEKRNGEYNTTISLRNGVEFTITLM